MTFRKMNIEELLLNPFTMINKDWMLVTAGDKEAHNTMTVSWGGLGEIWGHYASTIYIRPGRYTKEFLDAKEYFSLSIFDETHRDALNLCGKKSGRNINKDEATGLTALFDAKAPYYQEAKLVFICRKVFHQEMNPENILEAGLEKFYPEKDYHHIYIGEITEVLVRES